MLSAAAVIGALRVNLIYTILVFLSATGLKYMGFTFMFFFSLSLRWETTFVTSFLQKMYFVTSHLQKEILL